PRLGQVTMPHHVGALAEREALQLAASDRVEDDQLDRGGVRRIEREVDTLAVPRRAKRIRMARPNDARRSHAGFSKPRELPQACLARFLDLLEITLPGPPLQQFGRALLAADSERQRQGERNGAENDEKALPDDVAQ